ncbi:MAG: hypothetical protein V4525_01480 [Pseudomonadota bacterium]
MSDKIRSILNKMNELEGELQKALQEQTTGMFFEINGKRVQFEDDIKKIHRQLRVKLLNWISNSQWQNWVSIPFIYSMIIPLIIFDLSITLYQAICFPLYKITKVRRENYIVFDRNYLEYLNFIEKFHCTYCSYGNGVVAYGREIIARTEQYWCPIKHAHKVVGSHTRYAKFLEYGAAENYHTKLIELREDLSKIKED